MSIASELNALNGYILGAYDEINTKGGTVPANKNMANLASAIGSISTGSSTTITPLSVTENGTYTAPTGTAYSPVTVNVSGGANNNWVEAMAGSTTEIVDNDIVTIRRGGLAGNSSYTWITKYSSNSLIEVKGYGFYYQDKITEIKLSALRTLYGTGSFFEDGGNQFGRCTALKKIDLPVFDGAIYAGTFLYCSSLKALILRSQTMATLSASGAFNNSAIHTNSAGGGTGYIYVPSALLNTYKTAKNWSQYSNSFRAIEDYSSDGTVNGDINV